MTFSLDQLLEFQTEAESILNCYDLRKREAKKGKVLPNPLKILEFIRNSRTSRVQKFVAPRIATRVPGTINWLEPGAFPGLKA